MSDHDRYLERLGRDSTEPIVPDLATLRVLHATHMRAVPFENASVLFGERIALDEAAFIRKLGTERRGGFCYELNGAFGALLRHLGYRVEHLQARVYSDGEPGRPFEHLALQVTLDEPWLVDVGFGYSFAEPLRLVAGIEQLDPMGSFRLVEVDDGWDLEWQHGDGRWTPHYRLDPAPYLLDDFVPMCEHLRTSSDSPFTTGWLCSRLLEDGGVTLFGRRLVISHGDRRDERDLTEDDDLIVELERWFDLRVARAEDRWAPRR
jgi:N-hydroxyarylamine O-acetyltransferase